MSDTAWSVAGEGALRMAGFPFATWTSLLPADFCRRLVEVDQAEKELARVREHLLRTTLPAAVASEDGRPERRALSRIRSAVGRGRPADPAGLPDGVAVAVEEWNRAHATRAARVADVDARWDDDLAAVTSRLDEIMREPLVAEAVRQLSPAAADAFGRGLHRPGASPTSARERARAHRMMLFLQRLTAKNETNSFFGPVARVRLDPDQSESLRIHGQVGDCGPATLFPSPRLAVALSEAVAADSQMRVHLRARRSPLFEEAGGRLRHGPSGRSLRLTEAELALWSSPGPATDPAGERLRRVGALLDEVPLDLWCADPVRSLEDWLAGLVADPAVTSWRQRLGQLREVLEQLPGPAASELETALAALTGREHGRRGHGQMYADRSLVFEERRGHTSVTIGSEAARRLPDDLSPVLDYWAAVGAERYRQAQEQSSRLFETLWPGREEVGFLEFLTAAARLPALPARTTVEERVAALLPTASDGTPPDVELDPQQLRDLCELTCDIPVMSSVDVLAVPDARGDGRVGWVLGEAHAGHLLSVFPTDHFARELDPDAARQRDRRLIEALSSRGHRPAWLVSGRQTKIFQYRLPAPAIQLRAYLPEDEAIAAAHLRVRHDGRSVTLNDADGPLWLLPAVRPTPERFDPLLPFSYPAVQTVPFGPGPFRPRVTCGQSVMQRRSWALSPADVAPLLAANGPRDRFFAARDLRARFCLPTLVFARIHGEPKPVLLDFDNPLSVGAVTGLLARSDGGPTLSEMLPGPSDLWLEGRTVEMRLLAVRS